MAGGAVGGDGGQLLLQQHAGDEQLQRRLGPPGSSAAGLEGSAWGPSDPAMLDGGRAGVDGGAQGADGISPHRQSVTAGGRRVTGQQQGGAGEGNVAGRVGSATPPRARRTTMELGGGSRAGTPPSNSGFSAASSGNAAFSRCVECFCHHHSCLEHEGGVRVRSWQHPCYYKQQHVAAATFWSSYTPGLPITVTAVWHATAPRHAASAKAGSSKCGVLWLCCVLLQV
jgi:hypothetical protein